MIFFDALSADCRIYLAGKALLVQSGCPQDKPHRSATAA